MTAPIIVGTDGSEASLAAVDWSAAEAGRRDLPLHIMHVLDHRLGLADSHAHGVGHELTGRFHHDPRHQAKSALARACRRAAETTPGLDVRAAAVVGHADVVLTAISARASLLVVGRHGVGGRSWPRLGSVALCLASSARCPVVFTAAEPRPAHHEIVVGADGGEDATAALEFGFGEADMRAAQLTALHAWANPEARWPENDGDWLLSVGERNDGATAVLREQVAPWRNKYPRVPVTESVVHGHLGRALSLASSNADLVVIGGHRGQVSRAPGLRLAGDALLHHVHCPVALIPG
jgi:nucleotide-binding universal stress UspA family protein